MRYAEVIIPLRLSVANSFTYLIPEEIDSDISIYSRVVVSFGAKHFCTGIVTAIHENKPEASYEIKEITSLIDVLPVINDIQFNFWKWIASYYLCTIGEVYRTAMPSGLKLESETIVHLCQDYVPEKQLKPNEKKIFDVLSLETKLSVSVIERKTGLKNVLPTINSMLATGIIEVSENLKQSFKPKTELYIQLCRDISNDADIKGVVDSLKGAKQKKIFNDFIELRKTHDSISKNYLLKYSGVDSPVLNNLVKRNIFVLEEKIISRISTYDADTQQFVAFSEPQQKAYDEINKSFETKDITLLHGITSSGKTEIYIRLIADAMERGYQTLYLLPEIAITTQITERLKRVFGNRLFVYHSGVSDNERVEIWNHLMKSDEPVVILGIRSSVFLPFSHLGFVVVDEEQEPSYKQQEPAPRYHARNAAIILARQHGAKILLGSATPSLESYFWAISGKYGYVTLNNRFGNVAMPNIEIVNVREQRRKRLMKDTLFSPLLREKMNDALSRGEQIILFQNRRGFAPNIVCQACGDVLRCVNCDVSLTYHKQIHRLVCHYCGYMMPLPSKCPSCGSEDMKLQGFGTEKIEEEVALLFPTAKIARLDLDTTRTRNAYGRILSDFEDGKTQILIGTQMVSKGLDFGNVSVVGILNADGMMNIPDFRAYERAFQMMFQVSGRAGRRDKQGVVVLQTSQSENPLLQLVQKFDYVGMARIQIKERYAFHYPPYTRLIMIVLRCKNEHLLIDIASKYVDKLKAYLGDSVSLPILPPVTRLYTLYIRKIMLKINISVPVNGTRNVLEKVHSEMSQNPGFRQVLVYYDVDPQ